VIPAGEEEMIQSVTEPPVEKEEEVSTLTWVLIGIGAIVLAASLGGGSGGGSSDGSSGSTVTVTSDVPN
jgi:hypothetical protein